ncbi:oligosaccharide flippase family protein, partial [Acinetobacter baumannii]
MLLKNIFWIGLGQIVKIASQLIALFYLTSIVSPHAYGVLALAFVVVNFASLFSDMGTGTAIVQKKNITQTFINFLFRFNVFSGVCIMFLS